MITDDPNSSAQQLAQLRRENERLRDSVQQSSSEVELLRTSLQQSSQQASLFQAERAELLKQLKQKDHKINSLQHQLQALLRRYFGRSSEKFDPKQKLLFEDLLDKCIPETPAEEPSEEIGRASRRERV